VTTRPRARLRGAGSATEPATEPAGEAVGTNPVYVQWLVEQSMLQDARMLGAQLTGAGSMWQNPFAQPNPRAAIAQAHVWLTAYPSSFITQAGRSFLGTVADERFWQVLREIGIDAVHTGPVKQAGGLAGWQSTPSVDGHFDRISTRIDATFGDEDEFRRMCEVAAANGGTIIDDVVPGHTGKGADFRLAELGVGDYPGIYHMVVIPEADWSLLPEVPPGQDSVNLDAETERRLAEAGHIIGELQRVIFAEPGVKETNWSATAPVTGPDGVRRRWVYLHYFKQGQPSLNWLDPTFAGMRMIVGDALHSLADLGAGGLRFDANGFLGIERSPGGPARSEGHPLSEAANHLLASMVRKLGGFSFQELNLTIDDIVATSRTGADLSYDFVNRPAYHHALATGDTEFLRLTLRTALELGVDPASLVHALQNHDELTYELVHFAAGHATDSYPFRGGQLTGAELAVAVRADLSEHLAGQAAPYNLVFTTNGISSTIATIAAASLGYRSIDDLSAEQVAAVVKAHLLLVMFNAWQPGVVALSGWDLCGSLTVPPEQVADLVDGGDTRWIHRGGYDLMGYQPDAEASVAGLPRSRSLYGTLPEQLAQDDSFVSRLRRILAVRKQHGIAAAEQLEILDLGQAALLAMVHRLPGGGVQVTVLNFGLVEVSDVLASTWFAAGAAVVDLDGGATLAQVDDHGRLPLTLQPHQGLFLSVR
jgi:trehalose synthase